MHIAVLGGGPAGLYFALLMKKADPAHRITVFERNGPDDTFGWGVVFSDQTLGNFQIADPETSQEIANHFARWDDIDVHVKGTVVTSGGHGFVGIARRTLLAILQRRAADLGVELRFHQEIADPADLAARLGLPGGPDLIVAADGVNSAIRRRYAAHFAPDLDVRTARYIWLGTTRRFDAFTFLFVENAAGVFQAHAYRFDERQSAFIVECDEASWRAAGLDRLDLDASVAACETLFAPWLDGHPLLANTPPHQHHAPWLTFTRVRNDHWFHHRTVLIGDAAHTAHFSIGSGTKLAMEDAIALARVLAALPPAPAATAATAATADPADPAAGPPDPPALAAALATYEGERMTDALRLQNAARNSMEWFENVKRYIGLEPQQFAYSLLTRSQRVSHENLRRRDAAYLTRVERWFATRAATAAGPATTSPAGPATAPAVGPLAASPIGPVTAPSAASTAGLVAAPTAAGIAAAPTAGLVAAPTAAGLVAAPTAGLVAAPTAAGTAAAAPAGSVTTPAAASTAGLVAAPADAASSAGRVTAPGAAASSAGLVAAPTAAGLVAAPTAAGTAAAAPAGPVTAPADASSAGRVAAPAAAGTAATAPAGSVTTPGLVAAPADAGIAAAAPAGTVAAPTAAASPGAVGPGPIPGPAAATAGDLAASAAAIATGDGGTAPPAATAPDDRPAGTAPAEAGERGTPSPRATTGEGGDRSAPAPRATPPMFTPLRLRGMTLANRVVVSPMDMYSAEDGMPNDFHLVHLGARALGGAGLVVTEMTCVSPEGRITPRCTGMYGDGHAAAWRRIVEFVHAWSGARICLQLGHAGGKGATRVMWEGMDEPLAEGAWEVMAASPIPFRDGMQVPREMTRADMDAVRAQFVRATHMAVAAAFDMLELHCAHGYLLSGFITPLANRRTDEYGGALANRLRFPLEVFAAMRDVWPAERPMSVRISATDWVADGLTGDEAVAVATAFHRAGADILHVSAGQTSATARPVYGRMFQTPFSDRIRNEAGVPTIAVGNITEPDQVNSIIAAGRADLCALARPHLTDPHWTLRAAAEVGFAAQPWPLQYQTGKSQLERALERQAELRGDA